MSREDWRLGRVAFIKDERLDDRAECLAVRSDDNRWYCRHGAVLGELEGRSAFVFDPERDGSADYVTKELLERFGGIRGVYQADIEEIVHRAMTEWAGPDRPDEPLGVGAVVRDRAGRRWVRAIVKSKDTSVTSWREATDAKTEEWRAWVQIDAIFVENHGVVVE